MDTMKELAEQLDLKMVGGFTALIRFKRNKEPEVIEITNDVYETPFCPVKHYWTVVHGWSRPFRVQIRASNAHASEFFDADTVAEVLKILHLE